MASVTVSGNLYCGDGTIIPLEATLTEGTEGNLTTNTTYSVSAQNIGDYAPGKVVQSGYVLGHNMMSYCYVLRQGLIVGLIPVGMKGVMNKSPIDLPVPVTLQPGDICRAMTSTAASRLLSVYTVAGNVQRIFKSTTASGTTEPVDLQTGNSLGDTLGAGNQVITQILTTSIDGNKINGGGVLALNEVGQVVGCNPTANPTTTQPRFTMVNIPVSLNYKWTVVASS